MNVQWHVTPDSEPIEAIGYDEANEEAWVRFRSGSVYVYSSVPSGMFEQFRASDSKGGFLNRELRSVYPDRRE